MNASQLSPGLLRDYLEKRVPLGSFRLLTQVGYLMASAYETGQRTGNREVAGFGAKGLIFVEQTALDEGKTSLSWLLTGLPEPNFSQVQMPRARSSLKPFSRLCNPSWVAANVGYLRDLDFLESKIRHTDKDATVPAAKAQVDAPVPKKPWPKKKNKGKEGGGGTAESAEAV